MFSASQHAHPGSPWGHKGSGAFATPGPAPSGTNPMGASPAQQPPSLFGSAAPTSTPNYGPTPSTQAMKQSTPQQPGWHQPSTPSYAPSQPSGMAFNTNHAFSPAPHSQPTQPSPMQPGQAPVQYLPGYLNKMRGSERTVSTSHRPVESSPPPGRDGDTSVSLTGKDVGAGIRAAPSSSPSHLFSSSFFNHDDSARTAQATREGSIFGYGSLRGNRKQDDNDRSASLRAPMSPPAAQSTPFFGADYSASAMDDDDAPPQEALGDMTKQPLRASLASTPLSSTPTDAVAAKPSAESPLEQRVVLVYGFPAYLYDRVVEQFGSIGGLLKAEDLAKPASHMPESEGAQLAPASHPVVARLTFSAAYQALLAVRRSGELLANACMVGVRWESEALHQLSLVKGLDAPLVQPSERTDTPSTPAPPRAAPSDSKNVPLFGRPIDVVGTPVSALARNASKSSTASPLRAVVQAGEALLRGNTSSTPAPAGATGGAAPPSGMLGRMADSLFGW